MWGGGAPASTKFGSVLGRVFICSCAPFEIKCVANIFCTEPTRVSPSHTAFTTGRPSLRCTRAFFFCLVPLRRQLAAFLRTAFVTFSAYVNGPLSVPIWAYWPSDSSSASSSFAVAAVACLFVLHLRLRSLRQTRLRTSISQSVNHSQSEGEMGGSTFRPIANEVDSAMT